MKATNTIGIVIVANQNEVSKSEISKIRKAVKAEFPGRRTKVFVNDNIELMMLNSGKTDRIVYRTKDVNYEVWAEVDNYLSELHPDKEVIVLN